MGWRPKDWDVVKIHMQFVDSAKPPMTDVDWDTGLIEAGADAMLEVLRKQGYRFNQYTAMRCFAKLANPGLDAHGILVFIPDEES